MSSHATLPSARSAEPPLLAYHGTWRVQRRIVDHRAGTTATFTGSATVTSARFEEVGQLKLAGSTLNATRSYLLRFGTQSVAVDYGDGSPFIELQPRASQRVWHKCGEDSYVGRFFFVNADSWAEMWRVTGPRKGYVSLSRYWRAAR